MKRIPIAAAKRFATEHGLDRIVVLGTTPEGVTHIVTWGATPQKCAEAARAQAFWNGSYRDNVLPCADPKNINVANEPADE